MSADVGQSLAHFSRAARIEQGGISECWVYYATSHSSISVPENVGRK
jgi:hypothetical protein